MQLCVSPPCDRQRNGECSPTRWQADKKAKKEEMKELFKVAIIQPKAPCPTISPP
jgi:hypothetical protein